MADFKSQDKAELDKMVSDRQESLRSLRFGAAGSRSRNVREGRELKKDIARIKTELRAREIAVEPKKA